MNLVLVFTAPTRRRKMDKFEVGDIVIVKYDIAGMRKDEIGVISHIFHEHDMYEVYFNNKHSKGFYNMVPESLEFLGF
jgi:hypothetical protein